MLNFAPPQGFLYVFGWRHHFPSAGHKVGLCWDWDSRSLHAGAIVTSITSQRFWGSNFHVWSSRCGRKSSAGAPCEPKKGTATKILGKTWNQMRQKIPEIAFWRFPYFSLPLIWGGIPNRLRCQVNFNSQTHFSQWCEVVFILWITKHIQ